jgi:membrane fusion protein, multidrug efflux system
MTAEAPVKDVAEFRPVSDSETPAPQPWYKRYRWPLIVGGPLLIAAVGVYFLLTAGRFQSTDNAYVQIAKAPVSASIGGRVLQVYVTENQTVRAGQPLFRLDSRDLQVGAAEAEARLAQAELQVTTLRAAYEQQRAGVAGAQETVRFREREAARQQQLLAAGVASRQEAEEAAHAARQAREQLVVARQQAAAALAPLGGFGGAIASHPSVRAARAELERARLNSSYTVVAAPADGIVTRVEQLQPGAYVNPSQTVFYLLTGKPWIEANFKEDQLARMRVGQPVEIHIDAAPGGDLHGRVASFSPGTGAVFSPLPAQNATGNWVKVVQRLPVRIDFDGNPPAMAGRAGLSAHVKVDVRASARAD